MEYVIIAGNGKTSRANVEALMSDYYHAEKNQVTLYLYTEEDLSEAQIWAKQHAEDNGVTTHTVKALHSRGDGEPFSMFVLWDDEDALCQTLLAIAKDNGMRVFDLTNGLHEILVSAEVKPYVAPAIPEAEKVQEAPSEPVEEPEEVEDDEDEPDPEDALQEAVEALVDALVDAVMRRLTESLGEDK